MKNTYYTLFILFDLFGGINIISAVPIKASAAAVKANGKLFKQI